MRCRLIALHLLLAATANATTYHVDSETGDDTRSGTSIEQAWKSLARVNTNVFQPGDQLLFKSGSRFTGQFRPQGSGKMDGDKPVPIVVGKYGDGPKPRF